MAGKQFLTSFRQRARSRRARVGVGLLAETRHALNAQELESDSIRLVLYNRTHQFPNSIPHPLVHCSHPPTHLAGSPSSAYPTGRLLRIRRRRRHHGERAEREPPAEEAGGHPRAAFRDVRVRILQLLRGATDDGVAEQLCGALDEAMAEALETLRVAPVPHRALASTDLARTVGALLDKHGSARIRRLAGDVVRGWKAANVTATTAVKEELDKLSADDQIPGQSISAVIADGNARFRGRKEKLQIPPAKTMLPAGDVHKKKLQIPPAKMLPIVPVAEAHKKMVYVPPAKKTMLPIAATVSTPNTSETKKAAVDESKKMEATKRKLREGYQEAEKIKRQHTIQKIDDKDAAKMFEQKQRKMHPVVRERGGRASCRTSSGGVRRSLLPSLQMI
ncbi:hypothetical protein BDA96_07G050600 [Sorghum bicolor]|uniref:TFIIS N-terminal domain-containing protein n=1 Tax=Sorghum bicolor TaxID=4558 RepID=A0A921QIM1_SORBI|nr:hypothetical protein BDA96_07G050600 [Sorghum bicolor]